MSSCVRQARINLGFAVSQPAVPISPLCKKRQSVTASCTIICVISPQVEKSLQRIQNGQHNSMYTSQQSVENKVGGIPGWQALLTAVGFRLDPPASGLPAAVFFPTSDPGDRLQQCSTTIQSLLGEGRQLWALTRQISAFHAFLWRQQVKQGCFTSLKSMYWTGKKF